MRKLAAEYAYLAYINHLRKFRSVAEFGCGLATWLRVARELGATKIHGFDSPDLPLSARGLASSEFTRSDLSRFIQLESKFDLAICLEVAQLLPVRAGTTLTRTLCAAADWVLFGAAPPNQGGPSQQNENWLEYWAKAFSDQDYLCYDLLRGRFWHDSSVPFYMRQNACLFVRRGADTELAALGFEPTASPLSMIHPELYLKLLIWLSGRQNTVTDAGNFGVEIKAFYEDVRASARRDAAFAAGSTDSHEQSG